MFRKYITQGRTTSSGLTTKGMEANMRRADTPHVFFNGKKQIDAARMKGIELDPGYPETSALGGMLQLYDKGFLAGNAYSVVARWGSKDGWNNGNIAVTELCDSLECDVPAGSSVEQYDGDQLLFKGVLYTDATAIDTEIKLKAHKGYGSKTQQLTLRTTSAAAGESPTRERLLVITWPETDAGAAAAADGDPKTISVAVKSVEAWFTTPENIEPRLMNSCPVPGDINLWHCLGGSAIGAEKQRAVWYAICIRTAALAMAHAVEHGGDICDVDLAHVQLEYDISAKLASFGDVKLDKKSRFAYLHCNVLPFNDESFVVTRAMRKKIIAEAESYKMVAEDSDPYEKAGETGALDCPERDRAIHFAAPSLLRGTTPLP